MRFLHYRMLFIISNRLMERVQNDVKYYNHRLIQFQGQIIVCDLYVFFFVVSPNCFAIIELSILPAKKNLNLNVWCSSWRWSSRLKMSHMVLIGLQISIDRDQFYRKSSLIIALVHNFWTLLVHCIFETKSHAIGIN